MKTIKRNLFTVALLAVTLLSSFSSEAQILTKKQRYLGDYKWRVGIGVNMMDFNFNKSDLPEGAETVLMAIPSRFYIGTEVAKNLSIEASFAMNEVKKDNYTSGVLVTDDKTIYVLDGSLVYSIGGLFNIPYVDPYAKAGVGYLGFGDSNYTSVSFGGGLNFYLKDFGIGKDYRYPTEKWYSRFGINVEAVGRKNITNDGPGSHMQASAGVFYIF